MARRVTMHGHIRCLCGQLCPVLTCRCGDSTGDDRCTWCRWWDEHEPHDIPAQKTSIAESVRFVVDMMNEGRVRSEDVYPPGFNRYTGD